MESLKPKYYNLRDLFSAVIDSEKKKRGIINPWST